MMMVALGLQVGVRVFALIRFSLVFFDKTSATNPPLSPFCQRGMKGNFFA
jgi:hypothetical protein